MPTLAVERTKRTDVLQKLAASRFAFPSSAHPDWETTPNQPDPQMGIQLRSGGWIYPDLLVTEEPGHFIRIVAVVALRHEITEAEALRRWLPLSKAGPLYLFVPAGQAGLANRLCHLHGIRIAGLRSWRWTPAFGLDVVDAYSGPDLLATLFALFPEPLRPRAYRVERKARERAYLQPPAAGREGPLLPPPPPQPSAPALPPGPVAEPDHAPALPAGVHLPPPSPFPFLVAAGMILSGFGVIFPAELLGAGLATTVLGVLGWLTEDIRDFAHASGVPSPALPTPAAPPGVHMPPPSLSPLVAALGMILSGFGVIFPAELLGAGLAVTVVGVVGWLREDVRDFAAAGPAHHA